MQYDVIAIWLTLQFAVLTKTLIRGFSSAVATPAAYASSTDVISSIPGSQKQLQM